MRTVSEKFLDYIWLINVIRQAKKITFAQIQEKWIQSSLSDGSPLPRTTFNRTKDAIEQMFGIYIACDVADDYRYYIKNREVLHGETIQNWLMSTLTVNNIIADSLQLQNRIFLESIPADNYLQMMVDAMKHGRKVLIKYQKYGTDEGTEREIEPYCLKVYQRRWYVLGRNDKGNLVTFSFDRIQYMRITDKHFKMDPDFNAQEYFSDCYGVMHDERLEPQRIVLRAYGMERYYLEDLPLHASQRKVRDGEGYTDFELFLRPSSDFIGRLMSRGSWLQVMEPESVVQDIKKRLQDNLAHY